MDYLLRRLTQHATLRGLRGDHWTWFALAAGAFILRRVRRQPSPIVFSRRVVPGENLIVSLRSPRRFPSDEPYAR